MDIQEIEVVIAKDGSVQIAVRGVKGQSCLELTQDLEKSLGGVILSREMTSEAGEDPGQAQIGHDLRI
jgi:hypothetical protein